MSRAARVLDADRTAIMLDLLHRRHLATNGNARSHVVIEEVAPGTGWSAQRWADALVLSVWPSNGLTLDGYEIKASRADLKRELDDLSKHEAAARYCDTWNLLVWDEKVSAGFEIPADWGLWIVAGDEDGRTLKNVRKPAKRTPEPWPRGFICSMVRNAYEQAPSARWVATLVDNATDRAWSRIRREKESAMRSLVHPLATVLYGRDEWTWPKEAQNPEAVVKLVAERLTQLPLEVAS